MRKLMDFSKFIEPTVDILYASKKEMSIHEIDKMLIEKLNICSDDLSIMHKGNKQTEVAYRSAWARTYLKKYGLLDNPTRAFWKINDVYKGEKIDWKEIVFAVRNNKVFEQSEKVIQKFNIEDNNDKLIKELAKKYHNNEVSLFLGAGVSMAANMPSWDELVAQFMIRRFQEDAVHKIDDTTLNKLIEFEKVNRENSIIAQTRFIKQNIEPEKYIELLIESLYENSALINLDNSLFEALIQLIRNENRIYIKNIITFNFDDLIEKKLSENGIAFQEYANIDQNRIESRINICHVHGLLGRDAAPDEINLDDIIFSEEQYHKMYNDPFHWSNMKQVISLRENTCLFIGCSLTDPNMRRLLDIAQNNSSFKHFAIMKKEHIKEPSNVCCNDVAYQIYEDFYIQNRTSYFKSLGVQVIWVNDFDEIPEILKSIVSIKTN